MTKQTGIPMAVALVAACLAVSAYAAKGDKTADPEKRIEKIERKLERGGMDPAAAASLAQRQTMAAAASAPMPDRTSRSDRDDRSSSDRSSRSRSNRNEYREPTTPADSKYDSFRIIVERNIFNPSRIGRTRDRGEEKQPRVDTIALVGTIQSDKGVVAFFDSPDSALRKNLRVGQSVGEFKVEKIQPNQVDLSRNGKPVSLKVSEQLRRPEGGDWSVSAVPTADLAGPASAAAAAQAEPPPIPADASDALRRLMEARQKQLKQ